MSLLTLAGERTAGPRDPGSDLVLVELKWDHDRLLLLYVSDCAEIRPKKRFKNERIPQGRCRNMKQNQKGMERRGHKNGTTGRNNKNKEDNDNNKKN